MSETQYYVEYSKSNRSKCSYGKQCNDKIDKGELRLATHFEAGDIPMTKYRHWKCITRTIIKHINESTGGDLTGIDTLNPDDQDLVRETLERGYYEGGTEDINLAAKAQGKAAKDAEKAVAKAEKEAEKERIKGEKAAAKQSKASASSTASKKSKASPASSKNGASDAEEDVSPAASPVKRNRRGAAIKRTVVAAHDSEDDEEAGLSSEEDDEDVYSDKSGSDASDDDHHDDDSDEDDDESDEDDDEKPSSKRRKTATAKPAVAGTRQSKRVAAARK